MNAPVGPVPSPDPSAVGRLPSRGDYLPRRLRRLPRVSSDRHGTISFLLTICVDGRDRVLDNETTFGRLTAFLLDSPKRYHWFGRRFIIIPDHIHLIAHQGGGAVTLGQWIKALKAFVAGLERSTDAGSGDPASTEADVGRVPSRGV